MGVRGVILKSTRNLLSVSSLLCYHKLKIVSLMAKHRNVSH